MANPCARIERPVAFLPSEALDAVAVYGITKKYADIVALDDLTFTVRRGSVFGLIGSNGAGKSTTIGCLCGLVEPTRGEVRLFGDPLGFENLEMKRRLGVMPEGLALFEHLFASEFLEFNALMFGLDRDTSRVRALELLDSLGVPALSKPLCEFSAGMRKKVAFAAAVIHRPDLLLLDEPFASMDASAVSMLKEWLRRYACRGGTVLMTSHALDTVERFCDEVALIDRGRKMWQGDVTVLSRGGLLEAAGCKFSTLESLFMHFVGQCPTGPEWL